MVSSPYSTFSLSLHPLALSCTVSACLVFVWILWVLYFACIAKPPSYAVHMELCSAQVLSLLL